MENDSLLSPMYVVTFVYGGVEAKGVRVCPILRKRIGKEDNED
jgi:hypothetical protein